MAKKKADRIPGNETGSLANHVNTNDKIHANLPKNVSLQRIFDIPLWTEGGHVGKHLKFEFNKTGIVRIT